MGLLLRSRALRTPAVKLGVGKMGIVRWLLWLGLLPVLLAACGGGESIDTSQNTPSATELAQAASAELKATVKPETGQVALSWLDTVESAHTYRIERQTSDGQWQPVQTLVSPGNGGAMTSTTAVDVQGQFRVVAVLDTRTVVLRTRSGAEGVVVQTGSTPSPTGSPLDTAWLASVAVQLGPDDTWTEPVIGAVPLSLRLPAGWVPRSVQWFANLQALPGAGSADTGFATTWNTRGLVSGQYLITALVEVQADSFVEWRRTVQVEASTLAASVSVSGTQGVVSVNVTASSSHGVASVRTVLSGANGNTDLGTLTAPNGCSNSSCTNPDAYVYSLDTRTLAAGTYTFTSTVTDTRGGTFTATRTATFANPPELTVSQPRDGQWVYGELVVAGSTSTASASTTTTTVSLGSIPIITTTASSWGTRYSLAGVPAGSYVLTVRASNAQGQAVMQRRTILVMSDAAMVQEPWFDMGSAGRLVAAQGGDVLWQAADGTMNRRTASGDAVVMRESASLRYASGWQIDQGHVVAYGQDDDCPRFVCVYAWNADGQRRNLSALVSGYRSYDVHPVLRYPWVMWINEPEQYSLQHLAPPAGAPAQYLIGKPTSVTGNLGNWNYDFAVTSQPGAADTLTAFFWGTLTNFGSPTGPRADVYRWDSATQRTQALTASDAQEVYVQTDGQRVAWQKRAPGNIDPPFGLQVAPVSGASTTPRTASSDMSRFVLKNGLLVWHEGQSAATGYGLKVDTGNSTVTLSTDHSASLMAVAGTSVVWSQGGKLYAWREGIGTRLLLDTTAPLVGDATAVYLTVGEQGRVYRVLLP